VFHEEAVLSLGYPHAGRVHMATLYHSPSCGGTWYHKLGLPKIAFHSIVSKCEDLWEKTPLQLNE